MQDPLSHLSKLRAELDALDDQIHDLLMRRAQVVEQVARDGGKKGTKIRPGREAVILRRLLARHQGALPKQAIIRFWREMFGAALIIEGGQIVAVCDGDEKGCDRLALAREHFGPYVPVRGHHNPAQTLADVARGAAQLGVLPPPGEDDETHGGWWQALLARGPQRLNVIAKLPFWPKRVEGAPTGEAYVVAALQPDASGSDKGLFVLETSGEMSRARLTGLLKEAGFEPGAIWVKRGPGETGLRALVEVDGLVAEDDPRLAGIAGLDAPPTVVGGYAVPLDEEP